MKFFRKFYKFITWRLQICIYRKTLLYKSIFKWNSFESKDFHSPRNGALPKLKNAIYPIHFIFWTQESMQMSQTVLGSDKKYQELNFNILIILKI